jgi:hypothetical protein
VLPRGAFLSLRSKQKDRFIVLNNRMSQRHANEKPGFQVAPLGGERPTPPAQPGTSNLSVYY